MYLQNKAVVVIFQTAATFFPKTKLLRGVEGHKTRLPFPDPIQICEELGRGQVGPQLVQIYS